MERGHLAKRENTPTYRSCGDRLAGTKTKSALNLEVLSRNFALVRDFLAPRHWKIGARLSPSASRA
jgi:hypothetical protein